MVTRNHNKALVMLAIYTLTIFIYKDFGISNIFGYAFLGVAALYIIFCEKATIVLNNISIAFAILILFQIVEITRSILMGNQTHQMYIAAFILIVFFVFISDSSKTDVHLAMQIWKAMSIGLSFYVILVATIPSFYFRVISPILSKTSQEMNSIYLSGGYGIAIGGNIIIIDYIAAFVFLNYVCAFLIKRDEGRWFRIKCIIPAMAILLAFFLINRKTELIAILIAAACMFFSKTTFVYLRQRRKNIRFFLLLFFVMIAGVALLYKTDHLGRYGAFIEAMITNKRTGSNLDVSSGRILLWEIALEQFMAHPYLGIGWGMFSGHVPAEVQLNLVNNIHNVHNCYLQVMCETGIVGFLLFCGCLGYIFVNIAKRSVIMARDSSDADIQIINSTCVAYQLFFLICGAIDPTFYSIIFWLLYALSIMISNSVYRQVTENEK